MKRLADIEEQYNIKLIEGNREKDLGESKVWIMSCGHKHKAIFKNIIRRIERGDKELLCKSCAHKLRNKKLGLDKAKETCEQYNGELLADSWINNKTTYTFKSNTCGHTWESRFDNTINVAKRRGYLLCPECALKQMNSNKSKAEQEIADYIKSLGVKTIMNYRDKESNFEIDIYVPEKKFGVEYHGSYWHSEQVLLTKTKTNPKTYHKRKADEADARGIDLLQIFDIEWTNQKEIIKDIIKAKLGKLEHKIYARKCEVGVVPFKEAKLFFEHNHIFGEPSGTRMLGLKYLDEWVAIVAYRKEKDSINIIRYATLLEHSVIGGFTKLLKQIKKANPEIEIFTYADRRFSKGTLYGVGGFKQTHISHPTYYYIDLKKKNELLNRRGFQRKYLQKRWEDFDPSKTEYENTLAHGYDRVWDAGHIKYML